MDQKFLIVANWKSHNPNFKFEILNFKLERVEVAIAPPFPYLSSIPDQFSRCAQDVSQFEEGPYTGEVSAKVLKSLGVKYCLVGHSERRKLFKETTEIAGKKVQQCLQNDIIPIICARTLEDIPFSELRTPNSELLVMYEPEEAISTAGQYHPESAENINQVLQDWQGKLPGGTKFLYGGSVNPEYCPLLIAHCPLVSGLVVGHASLDANEFRRIIEGCLTTASSSS